MGSNSLLQGTILTPGSNPNLLHCRWIFLPSQSPGKPPYEKATNMAPNHFSLHLLEFSEWLLSEKPVCQNQLYPEKQPSYFGPREASPPVLSE